MFAQTGPVTVTSFTMNTDSVSTAKTNQMFCGLKTYSTGLAWLSVMTPADPVNQNFELQISTNDPVLAGTYTVSLVIAFADVTLTPTLTQLLTVNLLHPCKITLITTSQAIGPITFPFGQPPVLTPFTNFADDVSVAYSNPTLCGLTYSLALAADATTFGVSIIVGAPNQIQVTTLDQSLLGQTVTLTLLANATPQQDTPSQTVVFDVLI